MTIGTCRARADDELHYFVAHGFGGLAFLAHVDARLFEGVRLVRTIRHDHPSDRDPAALQHIDTSIERRCDLTLDLFLELRDSIDWILDAARRPLYGTALAPM